jgi:hypothetical protein
MKWYGAKRRIRYRRESAVTMSRVRLIVNKMWIKWTEDEILTKMARMMIYAQTDARNVDKKW